MTEALNVPIDDTHRASLEAVRKIRAEHAELLAAVDRWEPEPCPTKNDGGIQ